MSSLLVDSVVDSSVLRLDTLHTETLSLRCRGLGGGGCRASPSHGLSWGAWRTCARSAPASGGGAGVRRRAAGRALWQARSGRLGSAASSSVDTLQGTGSGLPI